MDLIDNALQFAAKAHAGQCRKGTDIPYISHPAAVGMLLLKAGYSDHLVAAGILHDTVEDTPVTLEDISQEFGPEIAAIVEGCSEPNKSHSWEQRKQHTIEFLKSASHDIKAVACADKLHNIRSISDDFLQNGEEVWTRFKRGKDQQKWYYTNIVKSLKHEGSFPLAEELEKEVNQLFHT
ncbi:HD domain-containing protein [Neobacillus sp. Marseille-QA0830]